MLPLKEASGRYHPSQSEQKHQWMQLPQAPASVSPRPSARKELLKCCCRRCAGDFDRPSRINAVGRNESFGCCNGMPQAKFLQASVTTCESVSPPMSLYIPGEFSTARAAYARGGRNPTERRRATSARVAARLNEKLFHLNLPSDSLDSSSVLLFLFAYVSRHRPQ